MSKNREIEILLKILKGDAGLQEDPESFDAGLLIRWAEVHKVVYPLLTFARKYRNLFTRENILRLENHCLQTARRSLSQLSELKRIAAALQENKIDFAVIKGPQLSRMLYGREALKESVDLDIMLAHDSSQAETHELLTRLGYTWSNLAACRSGFTKRIFIIAKREVQYISPATRSHIDLHIRPGANTYLTARLFRDFFNAFEDFDLEGVRVPVPPLEKYFAYLCYHGSLHQFSRLAWLLDIRAFLQTRYHALDFQKVLAIARSWRAERSVFIAMYLLQDYFGDEVPASLTSPPKHAGRTAFLASQCRELLDKDEKYAFSLHGRFGKLIYMMVLIKGLAGKIDLLFGILLRMVI